MACQQYVGEAPRLAGMNFTKLASSCASRLRCAQRHSSRCQPASPPARMDTFSAPNVRSIHYARGAENRLLPHRKATVYGPTNTQFTHVTANASGRGIICGNGDARSESASISKTARREYVRRDIRPPYHDVPGSGGAIRASRICISGSSICSASQSAATKGGGHGHLHCRIRVMVKLSDVSRKGTVEEAVFGWRTTFCVKIFASSQQYGTSLLIKISRIISHQLLLTGLLGQDEKMKHLRAA